MAPRSLADWLRWQESLNARPIDLGLERVASVAARLPLSPPPGGVYTVAGTNGKGSTVGILERLLRAAGRHTGLYTSPHLWSYTERVRIDGSEVSEADLCDAFAAVESARQGVALTYFEFGTLAALLCFSRARCNAWVLEVGLGGRLDAVNVLDTDCALITTIGLDHQEWLGSDIESIAFEKAGIMRGGRPAFYGDRPVPAAIRRHAVSVGAHLQCLGADFSFATGATDWAFTGRRGSLRGLPRLPDWSSSQYRNAALALAALMETGVPLPQPDALGAMLGEAIPAGRFQRVHRDREWILDVAHNPQAAATLRDQLAGLPRAETTIVTSLLADKSIAGFAAELAGVASRWIVCPVADPRSSTVEGMVSALRSAGIEAVLTAETPEAAFELAGTRTGAGGRIVVCGSFRLVAPALAWLGLYCGPASGTASDGPAAH